MRRSANGRYRNLHMHAFLFVNKKTLHNFSPKDFLLHKGLDVKIEPLVKPESAGAVDYSLKLVENCYLINIDFLECFVFHSSFRGKLARDELAEHFALPFPPQANAVGKG